MLRKSLIELNIDSMIGSSQKTIVAELVRDSENEKVYKPDCHREVSSVRILSDRTEVLMKSGKKMTAEIQSERKLACPSELFVYGRSDDLIEVDGSVSEEFVYKSPGSKIEVNDTEVSVSYDGKWYLSVIEGRSVKVAEVYKVGSSISEMFCDYSDIVRLGFKSRPSIEKI